MKPQIILFLLLSSCLITVNAGCKKDSSSACSTNWTSQVTSELNAFNAAVQAYSNNPNNANCIAYKTAATNYVNALKPIGNCSDLTGQNRTEWQSYLTNAEAAVAAISC